MPRVIDSRIHLAHHADTYYTAISMVRVYVYVRGRWVRNVQLAMFSCVIGGAQFHYKNIVGEGRPFMYGFQSYTWIMISHNAIGGLCVTGEWLQCTHIHARTRARWDWVNRSMHDEANKILLELLTTQPILTYLHACSL